MREISFRVWHLKEQKMYYRGYQKLTHVLLCEDDRGTNGGKGRPVKHAAYGDCEFLETTSLLDKNGVEIFQGDLVKIRTPWSIVKGVAGEVPDMFRSRKIHPLDSLLREHGLLEEDIVELEVIGNKYQQL